MSSSFIGYRGVGFWSTDHLIQELAYDVASIVSSKTPADRWKQDLAAHWFLMAEGYWGGCLYLRLDEYLVDDDRRAFLSDAVEAAMAIYAPGDSLHQTGVLLIQLLDGQIAWTAASPLDYMIQSIPYNDIATRRSKR